MHFTKMHGIGNDFIMINALGKEGESLAEEAQRSAVTLCDRKFGVGGDGVIVVLPGKTAPFQQRMFNPDGSEAEMCGNGIRCFAKYVYDRGLTQGAASFDVETGAGTLTLHCEVGADGKVSSVRVDMGEPVLEPSLVPTTLGADGRPAIDAALELAAGTIRVTCVSMGNPHAVTFVEDVKAYPVSEIGPQVESHPAFPRRTNTEFIQVLSPTEMNFRVWERGAAETLACGTGACAAAVAGVLNGKTGRDVLIHLAGGDLRVAWSEADNHVYMTGSATEVFEGEI